MAKATVEDAELILHLYELRTETIMRKARAFIVGEFWPQSADDLANLVASFGTQENAYLRQVLGYWDMAVSFVARGALSEELFADSAGEFFFTYAKLFPHISKVREGNPNFMRRLEEFVNSSKDYQERVATAAKNIARVSAARAGKPS